MTECSNCGFDVGDSKFCPNCGQEVISVNEIAICSNCGFDVGDSKFCPNCGTKIEKEAPKSFCPYCGFDVGDSKFCPNCGTKIEKEAPKSFCPYCGFDVGDSKFCPNCGAKKGRDNIGSEDQSDLVDNLVEKSDHISGRLANRLKKSKSVDKIFDKTSSKAYDLQKKTLDNSANRAYWENIDPNFFVVYDSIEDNDLQLLFWLERYNLGSSVVVSPTMGLSDEEAIKFYENLLNELKEEINQEKINGTFDLEEFHRKKMKKSTIENVSSIGVPKVLRSMHKLNKKK